jgi:hypothetical protein
MAIPVITNIRRAPIKATNVNITHWQHFYRRRIYHAINLTEQISGRILFHSSPNELRAACASTQTQVVDWWGSPTRRRKRERNPWTNTFGARVRLAPASRAMAPMQQTSTSDGGARFSETPARPWNDPLLSWRHQEALMTPDFCGTWQPRRALRRPGQAGPSPCGRSSAAGFANLRGPGRTGIGCRPAATACFLKFQSVLIDYNV